MSHDETNGTDRRDVPPGRCARHGRGPERVLQRGGAGRPRQDAGPAQAEARQDRPRDHDARDGHRGLARARRPRAPDPAVVRQRRPHVRHRQGLRHRARLQEVVRAESPEVRKEIVLVTKDNPRAPKDMLAMLDQRLEALCDRLRRPLLHPRPGRRPQPRRRHQLRQEPGVQGDGRGDPEVGQGEVRRLLDPPPRPRRRSSRRRPRAGSSTRSCSSTPPGSTRTPRSTRRSTPATTRGSA